MISVNVPGREDPVPLQILMQELLTGIEQNSLSVEDIVTYFRLANVMREQFDPIVGLFVEITIRLSETPTWDETVDDLAGNSAEYLRAITAAGRAAQQFQSARLDDHVHAPDLPAPATPSDV